MARSSDIGNDPEAACGRRKDAHDVERFRREHVPVVGISGSTARRRCFTTAFWIGVAQGGHLDGVGAPVRLQMETPDTTDADEADAETVRVAAQKFTLASIPIERGVLM